MEKGIFRKIKTEYPFLCVSSQPGDSIKWEVFLIFFLAGFFFLKHIQKYCTKNREPIYLFVNKAGQLKYVVELCREYVRINVQDNRFR